LIITNNVPSTLAYTTNTHIKTPDDLVQYSWTDCPPSLPNKMNSNKKGVKRLLEFGDVLSSTIDPANFTIMYDNDGNLCEANELGPIGLTTGTIISLPGSHIHAGPAFDCYRRILFFSGNEYGEKHYDAHIQFFAPLLVCELLDLLWTKMKVNECIYFIGKLKNYMDEENLVSMEVNLPHESMIELTNQLGQLQGKELENFILNIAKQPILE
jgi:hypothetical protein